MTASLPFYVGQTGRPYLTTSRSTNRLSEMPTSQPLLNMPSACSGHTNAWDEALVIDFNPHLHPQCAVEAWHIRSQPHPLNWECGNLSPA